MQAGVPGPEGTAPEGLQQLLKAYSGPLKFIGSAHPLGRCQGSLQQLAGRVHCSRPGCSGCTTESHLLVTSRQEGVAGQCAPPATNKAALPIMWRATVQCRCMFTGVHPGPALPNPWWISPDLHRAVQPKVHLYTCNIICIQYQTKLGLTSILPGIIISQKRSPAYPELTLRM